MDPNPKNFPILSYVMSRLQSAARLPAPDPDIEAAAPPPASPSSSLFETELVERMPHLRQPDLLSSMARAVSNVSQTRTILRALGERPDHEAVDFARARLVEIDAALVHQLEEIARSPLPDGTEIAERERECRAKADAQKARYKAVVQLEEMHEAYEDLLKESEERLEKIYVSAAGEGFAGGQGEEEEDEQVNEEVVAILQDASVKSMEMVNLSGRRLRILPEDFGKIRCLVSLDLSNNRLEALPDAIAGLEKLEKLYLYSNFLVSLPDSIGLLLNLKILDVSSNKLKALPDSISFCRSLVELNASYNALTYLPTNIGHELVHLEKLYIHLNKLRSLPTSICEMSCLRVLDAHFNELHGLPYSIGRLTNLETLNLSSNFSDLRELPPTFGDLISLRELDLSNNQIHALPDSFGRLENLTVLKLEQNPLAVPPVEVANQGVEAVKMYMSGRWLDMLIEEEQRSQAPIITESKGGWLSRSTSWLSGVVTGVSASVAGYFGDGDGDGENSYKDPCLDQQY